jgi:hypothetical protein
MDSQQRPRNTGPGGRTFGPHPELKKEHDENLKKRLEEIRKKNPKQRDARSRC